uniref:Uncharacterized protein n=1 Tax=Arundo donax TaxID=35708 RepID=A0A0A9BB83_ARUDO
MLCCIAICHGIMCAAKITRCTQAIPCFLQLLASRQ